MKKPKGKDGDLAVWWIPQVPGKPFWVKVKTVSEALLLLRTLADYDVFQFNHHIKPDYSNAGGLSVFNGTEWLDWENEAGDSIDDLLRRKYENPEL